MKTTKSSREKNTLKNNKIKSDIKNSVLALLNAISDCSFLLDNNGSIEWANVSACKMLSGKKTCHAGQKLFNLLPAQRKELFKNNFDKALKIKKQISFEVADKGIWHEINLYPIKDGKGNVLQIAVYIKNITESKHAEEALKKSEAIYKAQLENLPDMVMVIDRKFKILNVNKVIFSSGAVEELIGTDALLPIPKEMREMARTKVNECFKTGVIQEFEHKVANNKWVLVRFVPMLSDGKNINEVMIISTDITDRKNAEKMLMDNEERLSNFMESASDGIYILDSELNFIEINKKALEVVRKTKEDIIGKNIADIVPDVKSSGRYEKHLEVIRTGKPFVIEHFIPHPRFGDKHFVLTSFKVGDGVGVIAHDITDRKHFEDALQKSEDKFQQLFEHAPLGYQSLDDNGKFIEVNQAWLDTLGYSRKEVIGKWFGDFLSPEYVQAFRERFPVFKNQGYIHTEFYMIHKDGSKRYIAFDGRTGYNPDGSFKQTHCILKDETERKQAELDLQESNNLLSEYVKQSPIYTFIKSVKPGESRVIYASENYKEMTGISGSDMVGKTMSELFPAEFAEKITEDDWKVVSAGKVLTLDETLNNRYYITIKFPIKQESRSLLAGYTIDITERKTTEEALRESEIKFSAMFESIPVGMALSTIPDNRLLNVNPAWLRTYGYSQKNEVIGKTISELGIIYNINMRDHHIREFLRAGSLRDAEVIVNTKSGEKRIIRLNLQKIKIGSRDYTLATSEDITRHKSAEEDLRISEEKYRTLFNTMTQGVVYQDASGKIISANPAAERILGLTLEQMTGRNSMDPRWNAIKEDGSEFPGEMHPLPVALRTGKEIKGVVHGVFHPEKKSYVWIRVNAVPLFRPGEKKPYQAYAVIEDITDQIISEKNYRMLFREMLDGFALHEMIYNEQGEPVDYRFLDINPSFERMTGLSASNIIGRKVLEALPDTEEYWIKTYGKVALTGEPIQFENFTSALNKYFKVTAFRPAPDQFACIFTDITERKLAEEALKISEEKYRNIFESAPGGIFQSSVEGKFISVNTSYAHILGYESTEELLSKITSIKDQLFVNNEDYTYFLKKMKEDGKIEGFEHQFYKKDGSKNWLSVIARVECGEDGRILYYEGIVEDITRRKRAEEEKDRLEAQLRQAQKMEALGTFVGGIAHDFNNILSVLIGCTTLMKMEIENDNPLFSYVDQILASSEKAANLTKSLLAFSRNQPLSHNPVNINEAIKDIEKILKRIITEDITLNIKLCENDVIIMGDTSQIDQLFFNLATNARDAMPKGGSIMITTSIIELDSSITQILGYGKPGTYALITFADNGTGMDKNTKEHIFDPFFTTKEVGKGTGLGMSTVYGIVNQHGGFINIYSAVGMGTAFHIYFPLSPEILNKEIDNVSHIKKGTETILIAEDNEQVRLLMKSVLIKYGYSVIEAIDGEDAVNKFNEYRNFDLVILDSVMPKKNGREVYDEIKKINPKIKVLFCSGYTRDVVLVKGIEEKEVDFLTKPIAPNILLEKAREILDR